MYHMCTDRVTVTYADTLTDSTCTVHILSLSPYSCIRTVTLFVSLSTLCQSYCDLREYTDRREVGQCVYSTHIVRVTVTYMDILTEEG